MSSSGKCGKVWQTRIRLNTRKGNDEDKDGIFSANCELEKYLYLLFCRLRRFSNLS